MNLRKLRQLRTERREKAAEMETREGAAEDLLMRLENGGRMGLRERFDLYKMLEEEERRQGRG